jgi:hypothetical protein
LDLERQSKTGPYGPALDDWIKKALSFFLVVVDHGLLFLFADHRFLFVLEHRIFFLLIVNIGILRPGRWQFNPRKGWQIHASHMLSTGEKNLSKAIFG